MTAPPQDLVFRAAFLSGSRGLAAWEAWRAWVDLDDILDTGSFRLLPQLYRNLQKLGVDDPLVQRLKGVARLHWSKNQILFNRLGEINRVFRQAEIEVMVTGGAGMALSGHADTPQDPPYYYELMVHREDLMAAAGLLQEAGWQPAERVATPEDTRGMVQRGSCLLQDLQGSRVRVFWGMFGQTGAMQGETGVWERSGMHAGGGASFRVPGPEDQILYIAGQNRESGGSNVFLRAVDLMLVLQACSHRPDGERLGTLAREYGLTRSLQQISAYLHNTLGDTWLETLDRGEFLLPGKDLPVCRPNFHFLTPWEDFPPAWWGYLRKNRTMSRPKKYAGFVRVMAETWQWRYLWQVPVLGIAWAGTKVVYGRDR